MRTVGAALAFGLVCSLAYAQVITRVSVASNGTEGDDESGNPCIDWSGRFVAFWSDASNLVQYDTNGVEDVFVHDRFSSETSRVTVSSAGVQANAGVHREAPSISWEGRFVAFSSWATNLVPQDTNGMLDVFVHDRDTGQTVLVSAASDGSQGDGVSLDPSISADGRFISFHSQATNLVPGDTNQAGDVFVHDIESGLTTRASIGPDGIEANDHSFRATLSADARHLVFASHATNLFPPDANGWALDIFVHDRAMLQTSLISKSSDGAQADFPSDYPHLSSDGRYATFQSLARNLVPGDTNDVFDIFVHDRVSGETTRVSVATDGTQGDGPSISPFLSPDGQFVVFSSGADNLVPSDTNLYNDVFLHDLQTRGTRRTVMAYDGTEANGHSLDPVSSSDAMQIAFWSYATNLVAGPTNGRPHVYVYDPVVLLDGFESGDTSAWSRTVP